MLAPLTSNQPQQKQVLQTLKAMMLCFVQKQTSANLPDFVAVWFERTLLAK